jgi:hypothetical protein
LAGADAFVILRFLHRRGHDLSSIHEPSGGHRTYQKIADQTKHQHPREDVERSVIDQRATKRGDEAGLAGSNTLEPAPQIAAADPSTTKNNVNIQPRSAIFQSHVVVNNAVSNVELAPQATGAVMPIA